MNSAGVMAGLWLVFSATHVGPGVTGLRGVVTRRFGRLAFVVGFTAVANLVFAALPLYYASHRAEGPRGPALGDVPGLGPVLVAVSCAGLVLVVGACAPAQYVASALNGFLPGVREPFGLERITRHPFFVGLTLWGGAQALLASQLIGAVFFAGFGALGWLGTLHQERKLVAERGSAFVQYLQATSFIPFVAILRRRQRVAWREQPWIFLFAGAAVAWALGYVDLMAWSGVAFAATFALATSYFVFASYRNSLRASAKELTGARDFTPTISP